MILYGFKNLSTSILYRKKGVDVGVGYYVYEIRCDKMIKLSFKTNDIIKFKECCALYQ